MNANSSSNVARGEDHEGSDVDVFVETDTSNPFLLMDAKDFLERLVGRSVDVIRNHKNLNPRLRSRIERDGVAVFWVKGLRGIIAHHYFDVDAGQIFWILSNELIPLQTALQHYVKELSDWFFLFCISTRVGSAFGTLWYLKEGLWNQKLRWKLLEV